ncbi:MULTISPECIES: PA14 domain-containing protein [unclassified Shimia]|uniref:PA14 domain-containing protein n=1 Tax=unclassified Shimia TaxID=2630038 RepID=UPI00310B26BE
MKSFLFGAIAAIGFGLAGVASAQVINLTPANPQPTGLKAGLSVVYAQNDRGVRSLAPAKRRIERFGEPGKPLSGLNYPDKGKGAPVMTSGRAELVSAMVTGYIKFPSAGTFGVEFYTNDGAQIWISGQTVGKLDKITGCASAGRPQVNVPQAGWYDIKVLYFQKEGTACFESEWTPPGGKRQLIPDSAFGYK